MGDHQQSQILSFSDFSFTNVKQKFGIKVNERGGLFSTNISVAPSGMLREWLSSNALLGLSIGNEKARSEFVIAPVLAEITRLFPQEIGLFSGVDFNVDASQGLVGITDFLITKGPEQLVVESPILMVVEAKREDMSAGIGQCAAEMIAAQIFNQRANNSVPVVYGAVTIGSLWKFMRLEQLVLGIDLDEYPMAQIEKILGMLCSMVVPHRVHLQSKIE